MLKFIDAWDTIRVDKNFTEECIGYIHREYLFGINKYRFYPIQNVPLEAHMLNLISNYIVDKENKDKNGI